MIRVHDLDRSLQFYKDALGLSTSHRLDFPDFSLVYLRNEENDFEIELTWNKGQAEPYTHGSAYGHMAFCVEDLEAQHARAPSPRSRVSVSRERRSSARGQRRASIIFHPLPEGSRKPASTVP